MVVTSYWWYVCAAPRDLSGVDVIVLSYSALRRSIDALAARQWYYAVLDEGHAIQNPTTATSKAAKALQAKHRLVLSGTPVQVRWLASCVRVVRDSMCRLFIHIPEQCVGPVVSV